MREATISVLGVEFEVPNSPPGARWRAAKDFQFDQVVLFAEYEMAVTGVRLEVVRTISMAVARDQFEWYREVEYAIDLMVDELTKAIIAENSRNHAEHMQAHIRYHQDLWRSKEPDVLTPEDMHKAFEATYQGSVQQALHQESALAALLAQDNPPTQEVPPMSNFTKHTVYITDEQERAIRDSTISRKAATAILAETLLPEIVLVEDDVVRFTSDNGKVNDYEIIRIEGDDILVRRLTANSAGPAGEVHESTLTKYVAKIRAGQAEVLS